MFNTLATKYVSFLFYIELAENGIKITELVFIKIKTATGNDEEVK